MPAKPQSKSRKPAGENRGERLQKVLASAGLGSRRSCEELIVEGRVEVDGKVVIELGTRVDTSKSEIRVDGDPLKKTKTVYYAVNKPSGVICTNSDPQRRMRVIDLVPDGETLFTVGRLDRSSEGLILVTNDGDLANRIAHPRYGVTKTYLVRVAGSPNQKDLKSITDGVYLAEGFVKAESVKVKKRSGNATDLVVVLKEGRNREIRRVLAKIGFKVLTLRRTRVGTIALADLPEGAYRSLTRDEVRSLKHSKSPTSRRKRPQRQSKGKRKPAHGAAATNSKKGQGRGRRSDRDSLPSGSSQQGTVLSFDGGPVPETSDRKRTKANAKPPKGKRPRKARKGR